MNAEKLIWTEHLSVEFEVPGGNVHAVSDLNLAIRSGEVLCLLGESGCGKSVFGSSVLKLLPENALVSGQIYYEGRELTAMGEKTFRPLRGKEIACIPQSAATSLNPLLRCGKQVDEVYALHVNSDKKEARKNTLALFKMLGLPRLPQLADDYPHELSGGMRQRVLVAMGTTAKPKFIVVDEPTKGLDWARKREVVERIGYMQDQYKSAMLLITHDFSVAEALANSIAVMYAGEVIEYGPAEVILNSALHPYTKGIISALPQNGFHAVAGFSPSLRNIPTGCRFHDRCQCAENDCMSSHPELTAAGKDHYVRCPYA